MQGSCVSAAPSLSSTLDARSALPPKRKTPETFVMSISIRPLWYKVKYNVCRIDISKNNVGRDNSKSLYLRIIQESK